MKITDEALRRAREGRGHEEYIKLLIEAGADIYVPEDLALRHASEDGHVERIKLLLKLCADKRA